MANIAVDLFTVLPIDLAVGFTSQSCPHDLHGLNGLQ